MMDEFVDSVAGVRLLKLVIRGHALIAELLRLSYSVSSELVPDSGSRFSPVLHDFRYFKSSEHYEDAVEEDPKLASLDDELREKFGRVLDLFYKLFSGLAKYYIDLIDYYNKLQANDFMQTTLDILLSDGEGKQLLVEALTLQSVHLLLLHHRLPGSLREVLLIAFIRSCGPSFEVPNFEIICALCRATASPLAPTSTLPSLQALTRSISRSRPSPTPPPHPSKQFVIAISAASAEEYFSRFPIPSHLLSSTLESLRADDIFNQLHHFPSPEHRPFALSFQSACLFLLLYRMPKALHGDVAMMKEIVDKHFRPAGWMLPLYMGFMIDILQAWEGFKAAGTAVLAAFDAKLVRTFSQKYSLKVTQLISQLQGFLSEGILTQEFVTLNLPVLLACLRECNITIRWLLLHRNTSNKKLREAVVSAAEQHGATEDSLLALLLDTAQLEFTVMKLYKELLESKEERWKDCQETALRCLTELADYFSGSQVLAKRAKDANLQHWFEQLAEQVRKLDFGNAVTSARKVQQMVAALEEVEQFHQIQWSLQIKQHLAETRGSFKSMVGALSMSEHVLGTLTAVADSSYAWGAMSAFTPRLRTRVFEQPQTVLTLRCLFLKLRSVLDAPLLRISQSGSDDVHPVSQYYSSEMLKYVRSILEIIPVSLFSLLTDVIAAQKKKLLPLPARIEKGQLAAHAQREQRQTLAEAVRRAALLTKGIMALEATFVGVIELDPRRMLEDGIRRQLVVRIAETCDKELQFPAGTVEEFEVRVQSLQQQLHGLQDAMECLQDFVKIQGLHVWLQELMRVINFNTEQETNAYVEQPIPESQSQYQSTSIPIPLSSSSQGNNTTSSRKEGNFMGRLLQKLLHLSNPHSTMYLHALSGWFDASGKEMVGLRTFKLLRVSLGDSALANLDLLLSFEAALAMRRSLSFINSQLDSGMATVLATLASELAPLPSIPENASSLYAEALSALAKGLEPLVGSLSLIGQAQLLRRQIASHLRSSAKIQSPGLASALETASKAVIADVAALGGLGSGKAAGLESPLPTSSFPASEAQQEGEAAAPAEARGRAGDSAELLPILPELTKLLKQCGLHSPTLSPLVSSPPLPHLPILLFIFTISQLPRFVLDAHLSCLTCRSKKAAVDASALILGLLSLLRAFHASETALYVQYLAQYACVHAAKMTEVKVSEPRKPASKVPTEVINAMAWLQKLVFFGNIPQDWVQSSMPPYLFSKSNYAG